MGEGQSSADRELTVISSKQMANCIGMNLIFTMTLTITSQARLLSQTCYSH